MHPPCTPHHAHRTTHPPRTHQASRHGDGITVIMMSSNEQHEMVQNCILRGADSYLFKPLRRTDFSHIWQFVMQQQCHKLRIKQSSLKAERSELKYQRCAALLTP